VIGNEPTLQKFQKLLDTAALPSLGPEVRASREDLQTLEARLNSLCKNVKFSSTSEKLIRSLVLLWHDHLDESHTISQDIHHADGSFLHGIMHRREPDYGNAKYWFHRVGPHPAFPEIGQRAEALLKNVKSSSLEQTLISNGTWDAFVFVDAVEQAMKSRDAKQIELLQRIQEIEHRVLLEKFLATNEPASE